MRIIAGSAKGHRLKAPKVPTTRPATDLVRGAIFAMLESIAGDWSQVLDLFSGSGALGIEALSRGAGWVDFVERNPQCCSIIKENLGKTRLGEKAHVYCFDVNKAITVLDKEYDIVLVDPPWADESIGKILDRLAGSRLVGDGTVMVVTHSTHLDLSPAYGEMTLIKERRHGDSRIAIYRKEGKA